MTEPRRVTAGLFLALLTAVASSITAANLVSRPVGFVRIEVSPDDSELVTTPFHATSRNMLSDVNVLDWDAAVQEYISSGSEILEPGQGVWLTTAEQERRSVYLVGELNMDAASTLILYPGLNLVGYPYPTAIAVEDSQLSVLATNVGGTILDASSSEVSTGQLHVGQGLWYDHFGTGCVVWAEVRPFENIFPEESGAPNIESLGVSQDGSSVTLSIGCEGLQGVPLDIFYQDLNSDSVFNPATNWSIAAQGLVAGSGTVIEWIDAGNDLRASPDQVFFWCYLAARADVDLDGNGTPDARDWFISGRDMSVWLSSAVLPDSLGASGNEISQTSTNEIAVGETNGVPSQPSFLVGRIIYVDQKTGNDVFSGRLAAPTLDDGPKKTIRQGLSAVENNGQLVISDGMYSERLDIHGRDVSLRIRGHVRLGSRKGSGSGPVDEASSVTNGPSSYQGE